MGKMWLALAAAFSAGVLALPAAAAYPDHPITFINPNSAGGGTDVGVRTWVPYVEKCLGDGATFVIISTTESSEGRPRRLTRTFCWSAAVVLRRAMANPNRCQ